MDLEIRPIEPSDKAGLAAAVEHSSDEAIRRRFLGPHGQLTPAEIAVAVLESWQGRGVGKALVRSLADLGVVRVLSREAGAAELAVDLRPRVAD